MEIGFDWVCFPKGPGGADLHNSLYDRCLRSFQPLGDWVCLGLFGFVLGSYWVRFGFELGSFSPSVESLVFS